MAGEIIAPPTAPPASGKSAPGTSSGAPPASPTGAPDAKNGAIEALFDVKVNGQVKKLTQAQLVAAAQKGLFADQKLKSVDVLQGKTASLLKALKEDPLSVLSDPSLGISREALLDKIMSADASDATKEKLSKWVYDNVVAQAKKTPEQIEQEKKLSRLEQLEKDEEKRKSDALSAQQKQQVDGIYQAVRSEVTKQIVADKTFPQTEGAIRMVIDKLRVMNRKGAPVTAESITKALSTVKNDYVLLQQSILDADDDPETLIARIGEARALKISKALIARLKKKAAPAADAKTDVEGTPENLDGRNARKFGRERHGYQVLDVM